MLRAHLAALAPALEAARAEAEAAARIAQDRQAAAARAEAALGAMLASTSWRATAGLRRLATLARRLRPAAPDPAPPRDAPTAPVPADHPVAPPPPALPWYDAAEPEVSILVVAHGQAALTEACIASIHAATAGLRYEILLADNGSPPEEQARLAEIPGPFRLLRIDRNRRFGEGCNIAAEQARAPLLCLLNNDTEVTPGWLAALVATLRENPGCGAVGARLVFPDGRLQEAGATLLPDGHARQHGKFGDAADPAYATGREVHYVSGACLLLRRADFLALGGFDLLYEPGYYEDVDLCLRLRMAGRTVRYCPDAVVRHHEGVSHRGLSGLPDSIRINRAKFVARWRQGTAPVACKAAPPPPAPGTGGILLQVPDPLVAGSGLRSLLGLAALLAPRHRVALLPEGPCSRMRLDRLGALLGLDLAAVPLLDPAGAQDFGPDLVVTMGAGMMPPEAPPAPRRIHLCRQATPTGLPDQAALARLARCDRLVVPSAFLRRQVEAAAQVAGIALPPLRLVPPLVAAGRARAPRPSGQALSILALGAFREGPGGNAQDMLIRAFREVAARAPRPVVLHCAGATHPEPEHQRFVQACRDLAQGLPVRFHLGLDDAALAPLREAADLAWHGSGFGVDARAAPWHLEPCGTALREAMAQGALPFARDAGAPAELIEDGLSGHLCADPDALARRTLDAIAAWDSPSVQVMRHRALAGARRQEAAWLALVQELLPAEAALAS